MACFCSWGIKIHSKSSFASTENEAVMHLYFGKIAVAYYKYFAMDLINIMTIL